MKIKKLMILGVVMMVLSGSIQTFANTTDTEGRTLEQEAFIKSLYNELNLSKTDYRSLLNNISETKIRLEKVDEEKVTLGEQLKNIDTQILEKTSFLRNTEKQLILSENQLLLLGEELEIKEIAFLYQKQMLNDYIKVLYQEENELYSKRDDGGFDAFKMLLSDSSVGGNLKNLEYFALLNNTAQQLMDKLDGLKKDLEDQKIVMEDEKNRLFALKQIYEDEKTQLELQKEAKEKLLEVTLGQEKVFGDLIKESEAQQEESLKEIQKLNSTIMLIEERMKLEGSSFDPKKYLDLLDKDNFNFDFKVTLGSMSGGFAWPVDPWKGISAYFRDTGYVKVFGVGHNAIDIPQHQGTAVRAAADGVVFKAKDNGYGYSYIILAHGDGFRTVYGHISSILVENGQHVPKGAIIGLSGGMPGTPGAGYMTTGPHLHFEMLRNNAYVDPLDYLPLDIFDSAKAKSLPEKYKKRWEAEVGVRGVLRQGSLDGFSS